MRYSWLALMVAGMVAGCSTMSGGNGNKVAADDQEAKSRGAHLDGGPQGAGPGDPLSQRVFYFGYDSTDLSPADHAALMAQAAYMQSHPKVRVFIQGNADERGTREYNLALGERRARAVQQFLLLQGAAREKTDAVSYGQEQPAASCHDESCWHLNRRVELVYPRQ